MKSRFLQPTAFPANDIQTHVSPLGYFMQCCAIVATTFDGTAIRASALSTQKRSATIKGDQAVFVDYLGLLLCTYIVVPSVQSVLKDPLRYTWLKLKLRMLTRREFIHKDHRIVPTPL